MEYLHKFLDEIMSIDVRETTFCVADGYIYKVEELNPNDPVTHNHPLIKKKKFLDLSHYDQHDSNYEEELEGLQQRALTEFLNLNDDQQKRQLKRLEGLQDRFKNFYDYFKANKLHQYFGRTDYPSFDIKFKVLSQFKHRNFTDYVSHSPWFFENLMDAVMFKSGELHSFIFQIKEYLDINEGEGNEPDLFPKMILLQLWINDGRKTDEDEIKKKRDYYLNKVTKIKGKHSRADWADFFKFAIGELPDKQSATFEKYISQIQTEKYQLLLKKHNLLK